MWLEDIPEAAIEAALVPHPNLPFGSLAGTRPAPSLSLSLPLTLFLKLYLKAIYVMWVCSVQTMQGRGEIAPASLVNIS